jgi:hypothetical protein
VRPARDRAIDGTTGVCWDNSVAEMSAAMRFCAWADTNARDDGQRNRALVAFSGYWPSTCVAFSFWSAMSFARSSGTMYPALIVASRPAVNRFM